MCSQTEKFNRPCLKRAFVGKGVVLEICIAEGSFRVPHDDLLGWVGTNKNALETDSWQKGIYSWPKAPADMLCFLESYRVAAGTVRRSARGQAASVAKPDPPDISEDIAELVKIAVRHCRLPHPDVVKRMDGAVFPAVRGRKEQRGETGIVDGRRILYDDNTAPRWALLWAHGFSTTAHPKGWVFAHVWDDVKAPDAYTHLANLAMMPESFGGLSDKQGPLVPYLRHHAEAAYGWWPDSRDPVAKPPGYDDLVWNCFDPIPDPMGVIRERISKSNAQRAIVLRELLGWD
ncbi:MAG: hypothetical protein OXC38_07885 [Gammaproteobacteria bacterium]|nr:hypothetical protein [Gammaproteobacteria bacterium]